MPCFIMQIQRQQKANTITIIYHIIISVVKKRKHIRKLTKQTEE